MKDRVNKIIAERIKKTRKEKGLKQSDLARGISQHQPIVHHWETGRNMPNVRSLKDVSIFLGVSMDYLVGKTNKKTLDSDSD